MTIPYKGKSDADMLEDLGGGPRFGEKPSDSHLNLSSFRCLRLSSSIIEKGKCKDLRDCTGDLLKSDTK